ncbi:transposable element Tcb1 transposase [Trichonephila clavipes]|nr:transposable element Tcb1 transposase [Trichonephila clavipes]
MRQIGKTVNWITTAPYGSCSRVTSPSQELGSFVRQQVSASTHGLSAWRPWLRLRLTLHHRQKHLQWCGQRPTWAHERQDMLFSDESRFCLLHQDNPCLEAS